MTTWMTATVAVHRRVPVPPVDGRPVLDGYGQPVTETATHPLPHCTWEPRPGTENVDAREQVTAGLILYCDDPDADLAPADTMTVEGDDWQVQGPVARYRGGPLAHASAILSKVTG